MFKAAVPVALASSLLALGMIAAPAHAGSDALLYERALMLEADRRCVLFTAPVRASLRVAAAQARGAALRARADVPAIEDRARRRALATRCGSSDLRLAAARVRDAHAAWSRVQRLTFPGDQAEWRVDRTPSQTVRWRLVQTRPAAAFGLAGAAPADARLYAVARFRKKALPALVRLTVGRQVFLAEARAPAPELLRPADAKGLLDAPAWTFRFPAAATAALDEAGPYDPIRLDFVGSDRSGGRTSSVAIERGDFEAARAFSRL